MQPIITSSQAINPTNNLDNQKKRKRIESEKDKQVILRGDQVMTHTKKSNTKITNHSLTPEKKNQSYLRKTK